MKTLALTLSLAFAPLALADETHHTADPQRADPSTARTPQQAQQARTASASGRVQKIEPDRGSITIAHGPVPALRWPAMVMPFKASAEQMQQVAVGDEVNFEFSSGAAAAELISIEQR